MRFLLLLLPFIFFSVASPPSTIFNSDPGPEGDQVIPHTKPFEIFPNPAKQFFSLKSEYFSQVPTELSVFDVSGRMVIQLNALVFDEENISRIDISFLSSGLYFIKLRAGNYSATKKVFKI